MAQNRARAEKAKLEEEASKQEQRRLVAEHASQQEALKEAHRKKLLVGINADGLCYISDRKGLVHPLDCTRLEWMLVGNRW